jgi:hypothetical protein
VVIAALTFPVWAQTEAFDLFRFQGPQGWKRSPGQDEYLLERVWNNQFCQIALYRSAPSKGSAGQDFDREWELANRRLTVVQENPREVGTADGWTVTKGGGTVESAGSGRFLSYFQVYSGFGVRAVVVVNTNHTGCKNEIQAFLGSIRMVADKAPAETRPGGGVGSWVSSGELSPELGAWPAVVRPDHVQFSQNGVTARVYYAVEITDGMRRGDMRQTVWNMLVTPQFRAGEIRYWDNGPGAGGPYTSGGNFLMANAVEVGTGGRVVVGMNYATDNGMMRAVVAIARDEATFARLAGTPEKIDKLARLNMFAVPAREMNGRWTTSFASAAEMYSVATGYYAGLAVAGASLDIAFDNGNYQSRTKATVGRVGALNSSSEAEAGGYQLHGTMLTLAPQGKEKTAYIVWFEAVRGGMMLHMVNNQYRGSRWDLLRAK